ncbi:MAG: DUF2252 family protein [Deltaproteobacteria bacterium]|nr:DUF2252 family protein [Deltaproteobacteria bacterium]
MASLAALTACLPLAAGCDEASDPRAAWLAGTLAEDNLPFALREPASVLGKYRKMAADPYAFFRGTAAQFARDAVEPGGAGHFKTAYATADTASVLLVGDPHPENIGTFRPPDGALFVDFNDYDAARYGPYHLDVRRLATGFLVACEGLGARGDVDRDEVALAVGRAYAETILALAVGEPLPSAAAEADAGRIGHRLLKKAREDGQAREELDDYTLVAGNGRALADGVLEPPTVPGVVEDELAPVTAETRAFVDGLVARYQASLAAPRPAGFFRVKDVRRRLGAGVASYPLWRFYVLVEGEGDGPDDDVILEVKEVWDPLALAGLDLPRARAWGDNGERVVTAQRTLQGRADADPLLGWATAGAHAFRVRERTKFQRGFGVDELREKVAARDWRGADVVAFARLAGRLLAEAHARAPRLGGGDAATAIAAALHGDAAGFARETAAFAAVYRDQVLADHERFRDLLARDEHALLP